MNCHRMNNSQASNDFFLDLSISMKWDRNFFTKWWVSLSFNIFSFSLSIGFTFLWSFVIIFKMLSRWYMKQKVRVDPTTKQLAQLRFCSVGLSTCTSTVSSDGALRMSYNPFHTRDKRPITSRTFSWNISIWWSDVMNVCEDNNDLINSSRGFTCWRFEGTRFSVNKCSSVSLSGT